MRHYSLLDRVIGQVDGVLNTLFATQTSIRPHPDVGIDDAQLEPHQKRQSQGYMRVNHTGEVCAQALYRGQMVFAEDDATYEMLHQAAVEETDHLAWTHQRLQELETHRSYLNLFWYVNSFLMGMLAAKIGDKWSLGFVEETERQVAAHLTEHLDNLATEDQRSRAIVEKMREDEEHHGAAAKAVGAADLPGWVKQLMQCHALVMKRVAYFI